jgi:hypothetical protein
MKGSLLSEMLHRALQSMCQPALFGGLIGGQPRPNRTGMAAHFLGMAAFKWAENARFHLGNGTSQIASRPCGAMAQDQLCF